MNELLVEYNYEFQLIGIKAAVKSHKLAWWLNNLLAIRLIRKEDIELSFLDQTKVIISNFLYKTEHSYIRLLKNRSEEAPVTEKPYLIPELAQYDFLMMIHGFEGEQLSIPLIKEKLNRLAWVGDVAPITVQNLETKENLIF